MNTCLDLSQKVFTNKWIIKEKFPFLLSTISGIVALFSAKMVQFVEWSEIEFKIQYLHFN